MDILSQQTKRSKTTWKAHLSVASSHCFRGDEFREIKFDERENDAIKSILTCAEKKKGRRSALSTFDGGLPCVIRKHGHSTTIHWSISTTRRHTI